MKKITIQNLSYSLPTQWKEVSIRRYSNMQRLVKEAKLQEEPDILIALKTVAALIDCEYSVLLSIKSEEYSAIVEMLSFCKTPPVKTNNKVLTIDKVQYSFIKDLTQLTMGQTIDLEMVVNDSNDSNFIMNVLPLLVGKEGDEFTKELYTKRKELFADNINILDALYVVDFFLAYRSSVFYNHSSFFGNNSSSDSKAPDTGSINSRFMWLMMVDKLCKELNMIPKQVYDMNYLSCLNWLSLYHYQSQIAKQNKNTI